MAEIEARRATPAEVLAIARPLLPHTFNVVADLEGTGAARRTRQWVLAADGEVRGAVILSERCRGRWEASPILLDSRAAPVAARLIDRSPAWEVGGAAAHMEPIIPWLRRNQRRAPIRTEFYEVTSMPAELPQASRCRLARLDDLDALVELYRSYELGRIPTVGRWREYLGRLLVSRPLLVAEVDGRVVGATTCPYRTATHDMWSDLTLLPDFRGQGLGYDLGVAMFRTTLDSGRIFCGVRAPSNPLTHHRLADRDQWAVTDDVWVQQPLQSPRRFPGHRRLRRLLYRLGGVERRPLPSPDAGTSESTASTP